MLLRWLSYAVPGVCEWLFGFSYVWALLTAYAVLFNQCLVFSPWNEPGSSVAFFYTSQEDNLRGSFSAKKNNLLTVLK